MNITRSKYCPKYIHSKIAHHSNLTSNLNSIKTDWSWTVLNLNQVRVLDFQFGARLEWEQFWDNCIWTGETLAVNWNLFWWVKLHNLNYVFFLFIGNSKPGIRSRIGLSSHASAAWRSCSGRLAGLEAVFWWGRKPSSNSWKLWSVTCFLLAKMLGPTTNGGWIWSQFAQ